MQQYDSSAFVNGDVVSIIFWNVSLHDITTSKMSGTEVPKRNPCTGQRNSPEDFEFKAQNETGQLAALLQF
jgi:hypothetical protein